MDAYSVSNSSARSSTNGSNNTHDSDQATPNPVFTPIHQQDTLESMQASDSLQRERLQFFSPDPNKESLSDLFVNPDQNKEPGDTEDLFDRLQIRPVSVVSLQDVDDPLNQLPPASSQKNSGSYNTSGENTNNTSSGYTDSVSRTQMGTPSQPRRYPNNFTTSSLPSLNGNTAAAREPFSTQPLVMQDIEGDIDIMESNQKAEERTNFSRTFCGYTGWQWLEHSLITGGILSGGAGATGYLHDEPNVETMAFVYAAITTFYLYYRRLNDKTEAELTIKIKDLEAENNGYRGSFSIITGEKDALEARLTHAQSVIETFGGETVKRIRAAHDKIVSESQATIQAIARSAEVLYTLHQDSTASTATTIGNNQLFSQHLTTLDSEIKNLRRANEQQSSLVINALISDLKNSAAKVDLQIQTLIEQYQDAVSLQQEKVTLYDKQAKELGDHLKQQQTLLTEEKSMQDKQKLLLIQEREFYAKQLKELTDKLAQQQELYINQIQLLSQRILEQNEAMEKEKVSHADQQSFQSKQMNDLKNQVQILDGITKRLSVSSSSNSSTSTNEK